MRAVRVRRIAVILPVCALSLGLALRSQDVSPPGQNEPAKKPPSDYMNNVLLRNTTPLGLKENPSLTRMLKQPSIQWAIRAASRHILG